jgi:hypothetical protein
MTYGDHIRFLDLEIANVGAGLHLDFGSFVRVLADRVGSAQADEACLSFAASLEWPPMSDEVRFEVCLRLSCARAWCAALGEVDVEAEESGRELLENLTTVYWRDGGRVDWLWPTFVKEESKA